MLDTGSTDSAFPSASLNDYSGPTVNYTVSEGTQLFYAEYSSGANWYSYKVDLPVGLAGTSIAAEAPIFLMQTQNPDPKLVSGSPEQGILGVAFQPLSAVQNETFSIMDAWLNSTLIEKNEIAFHGCPYSREKDSWIDFGNETPYRASDNRCSAIKAKILMPAKTYFTITLEAVAIGSRNLNLPSNFQSSSNSMFSQNSVIDSCTTFIYLPAVTVERIRRTISNSGAFDRSAIGDQEFEDWLLGKFAFRAGPQFLDFDLLPPISFQFESGHFLYESVTLTLGPRQYIQVDSEGYCNFSLI
jgi:hypothetical protein